MPTELLDWDATESNVRPESREAMRAVAQRVARRMESGQPLNPLHAALDFLFDRAEMVMGTSRWGTGVEIGAGAGYAAALLSRRAGVERIYVVEHSREFVTTVMPVTFASAGADESKIVRAVGSFDRIALEDGSLDFVLEVAALHHAEDLPATLRELWRVLRPGGFVVALDRYRPDETTDAELEQLLDLPLAPELAAEYGFEEGRRVTRREVGEHELRLAEWKVRFLEAGFEIHPFMGVDFSGRLPYRVLGLFWRAFLEAFGERLFLRRRRCHVLATQIPFDIHWLLRQNGPATNLFMVARKQAAERARRGTPAS